jgi:hypothetical protein
MWLNTQGVVIYRVLWAFPVLRGDRPRLWQHEMNSLAASAPSHACTQPPYNLSVMSNTIQLLEYPESLLRLHIARHDKLQRNPRVQSVT